MANREQVNYLVLFPNGDVTEVPGNLIENLKYYIENPEFRVLRKIHIWREIKTLEDLKKAEQIS